MAKDKSVTLGEMVRSHRKFNCAVTTYTASKVGAVESGRGKVIVTARNEKT